MDSEYRLNFGRHKGKTLSSVPSSFIDWLHEDNVAAKRPELKRALQLLSNPSRQTPQKRLHSSLADEDTPSKKAKNERDAPQLTPSSENKENDLDKQEEKEDKTYVIHFGKYKGEKLSNVPSGYLMLWMNKGTSNPFMNTPKSKAAWERYWKDYSPTSPALVEALRKSGWTPPALHSAPAKFRDDNSDPLWVAEFHARKTFSVIQGYLDTLPVVNKNDNRKGRYWLYHIWDLVRFTKSEAYADTALYKFKQQHHEWIEDRWAGMGLGACLV
ncbi:uncharacterized protein LY89DRAFT_688730 [Mollisia scopiformis]|uniref:Uncharacterized protein n=1 Tax=Mollisia scopiformis TaxID=149040 RepID=A0A194WU54_MOLSC|nr:uncharacterized protein LY89DRAFT_688730 [Mollisia scopiformis]KUJ11491.1 hypothetical protein LY89DRAFT_688730 [Mollisia scopiformis]